MDVERKVWGLTKDLEFESGLKVTIRQWSTGKLFHCFGLIASIAADGLEGIFDRETGKLNVTMIATNLLSVVGAKMNTVLDFVSTSAEGVGPEDVSEWLPGDLFDVLREIIEQNLNDDAGKKFEMLLGTILTRSAKTLVAGSRQKNGSGE